MKNRDSLMISTSGPEVIKISELRKSEDYDTNSIVHVKFCNS
jgi:hypothetical protein